ncbi:MAG: flavodoxin domain-containing protein [Prevotella sp.]|nr:flavodoxin domain-containing protein [Prevotella sp.]
MRKESIIVVYGSNQAIAEEIADKLGAETLSVEHLSHRNIENSRSMILGIDLHPDGQLTPSWQYAHQLLQQEDLSGKAFAEYVALGSRQEYAVADEFQNMLKRHGAHVVSDIQYVASPQWNTDYWIGTVSPSL